MTMNATDWERLWNAADDYEADMLQALAVKAGLLWECKTDTGGGLWCGYVNSEEDPVCADCGEKKPEGKK